MASYFGLDVSGSTDMSSLLDAYRNTRQGDLDKITSAKTGYQSSLTFWNQIHSRVNSLNSAIDVFDIEETADDFITRSTSSSDDSVVSVSSDGSTSIGTTIIKVEKLAEKDLLLSKELILEESFGEVGTKVFTLTIGSSDFDVSVEFDGAETNAEALKKIATAINEIEDVEVNATYVKNTPETGILSLMSDETGEDHSISISGSPMLAKLGLDNLINDNGGRIEYTSGVAGYRYSDASTLNSLFNVNGIEIERTSNMVDDVIEGMEIKLKTAQNEDEQAVYLETDIDVDEIKSLIQPTLDAYNTLITDLYTNKSERRASTSLNSLYTQLRDISSSKITSVTDNTFKYIVDLGIDISSTGQLSFSDDEILYDALKEFPEGVAELFMSEDGLVNKMQDVIKHYHGENNLVNSMTEQLNYKINRADDRYKRVQSNIDKEVSNMQQQYTSYLESYYEAQSQLNYLQTMPTASSSAGSSNSSLLQAYYGG